MQTMRSRKCFHLANGTFVLCVGLLLVVGAQCFTAPSFPWISNVGRNQQVSPTFLRLSMTSILGEATDAGPAKQVDPHGKEIIEGCIVRVAQPIRAFHVQCFGKISENKAFIPAPEYGPRATKCLEIPSGLRGIVTRVFDVNDYDASQPIVVKFVPGSNCDEEGYATPVQFVMHFDSSEVERVD